MLSRSERSLPALSTLLVHTTRAAFVRLSWLLSSNVSHLILQRSAKPRTVSRKEPSSASTMRRLRYVSCLALLSSTHDIPCKLPTYEILVGNLQGLRWVSQSGKLNISSLGYKPVDGGRDVDGTPLFIAKAPHNGADHPGKCSEKLKGPSVFHPVLSPSTDSFAAAYIGYGGKEKEISVGFVVYPKNRNSSVLQEYQVLCYA